MKKKLKKKKKNFVKAYNLGLRQSTMMEFFVKVIHDNES